MHAGDGQLTGHTSLRAVTFVAAQLEPLGGMERAALSLVEQLATSYEVSLLTYSGPTPSAPAGVVEARSLELSRRWYRLIAAWFQLKRDRQIRERCIIALGVWAAIPLLAAGAETVIVWEHSLTPLRIANDNRARLLSVLARVLYRRAARLVGVSDAVTEFLRSCAPVRRVELIPNLIAPAPRPAETDGPQHRQVGSLVCISNLIPVKNVGLAIEALTHISRNVSLTVVGDGPLRAALEETARRLGLNARISFTGRVADVSPFLATSELLIHPSLAESFGYALIEAAERGVPVVALDRPNMNNLIPELVPGVLVGRNNARSFASAIEDAMAVSWSDESFRRASRARSRYFDRARTRRHWEQAIESVSRLRAPPPT